MIARPPEPRPRPAIVRLAALLLLPALALTAACAADDAGDTDAVAGATQSGEDAPGDPLQVVATMSIVGDLAEQVGGDLVEVEVIVPVGADPHTFEPTPSDAATLEGAQLVVANGAGLEEGWLLSMVEGQQAPLVLLAEGLDLLIVEEGEDAGEVDPHLWNDPVMIYEYVDALLSAYLEVDPDGEEVYRANAEAYREVLDELDAWIIEAVETIPPEQRLLVTTHDAFSYFGERYGLTIPGTLYGVSTENEPSAGAVADLVTAIREAGVPTVFVETLANPQLMQRVADESGAEVGDELLGDSVGDPGSGAETYEGMMRYNVNAIVTGLGGEVPS